MIHHSQQRNKSRKKGKGDYNISNIWDAEYMLVVNMPRNIHSVMSTLTLSWWMTVGWTYTFRTWVKLTQETGVMSAGDHVKGRPFGFCGAQTALSDLSALSTLEVNPEYTD